MPLAKVPHHACSLVHPSLLTVEDSYRTFVSFVQPYSRALSDKYKNNYSYPKRHDITGQYVWLATSGIQKYTHHKNCTGYMKYEREENRREEWGGEQLYTVERIWEKHDCFWLTNNQSESIKLKEKRLLVAIK